MITLRIWERIKQEEEKEEDDSGKAQKLKMRSSSTDLNIVKRQSSKENQNQNKNNSDVIYFKKNTKKEMTSLEKQFQFKKTLLEDMEFE